MNEIKANYAKIGLFVLTGFALIVIAIGIAGARVFNKPVVLAETYFTESVTGLDVGSPVKYRGVPVGEVSRIGFVFSEYGGTPNGRVTLDGANQILVVMALDPNKFTPLQTQHPAATLDRLVRDGMRVKLAAAGVTGLSFLELDYLRTAAEQPFPVSWQPKRPYIPSAPSTILSFKKAIDDVFFKLNSVDIQGLGNELLATLRLIQEKLGRLDTSSLSTEAVALITELRATNRDLQKLVSAPELQQFPAELGATIGSAHRIATGVEAQLDPLLLSFRSTSEQAQRLSEALNGIATNATPQIAQTVEAFRQTAQTLNRTATAQQDAFAELIQNLRNASAGLEQIILNLQANPSALLFSRPPEPLSETREKP